MTGTVKALEWEQPDGPHGKAWLGHGFDMCQYYIRFDEKSASYWLPGDAPYSDDDDSAQEFQTLDVAKAAAQADYERRILSALTASASEPEPVATPKGLSPLPWSYHNVPGGVTGRRDWVEDAIGNVVVENVGHIDGPFIVACANAGKAGGDQ